MRSLQRVAHRSGSAKRWRKGKLRLGRELDGVAEVDLLLVVDVHEVTLELSEVMEQPRSTAMRLASAVVNEEEDMNGEKFAKKLGCCTRGARTWSGR